MLTKVERRLILYIKLNRSLFGYVPRNSSRNPLHGEASKAIAPSFEEKEGSADHLLGIVDLILKEEAKKLVATAASSSSSEHNHIIERSLRVAREKAEAVRNKIEEKPLRKEQEQIIEALEGGGSLETMNEAADLSTTIDKLLVSVLEKKKEEDEAAATKIRHQSTERQIISPPPAAPAPYYPPYQEDSNEERGALGALKYYRRMHGIQRQGVDDYDDELRPRPRVTLSPSARFDACLRRMYDDLRNDPLR